MSAKKALRDSSSRTLGARALAASAAASAVATGHGAMVLAPDPNIFYTLELSASLNIQATLTTVAAEEGGAEQETNLEIQTLDQETQEINQEIQYTLRLTNQDSKSSVFLPVEILGPDHFVGIILLTSGVGAGEIIGADSDFSESLAQVDGSTQAYYGFTLMPPESVQSRSEFDTESETNAPLYGWVKLDTSNSTSESVNVLVDWAYDDSGQPVIVGSAQPIPEASTLGLAATGLLLAGGAAWRRRRLQPGPTARRGDLTPSGRWQVWAAQRPSPSPQLRGDWVVLAGDPQTIVGHATLRDTDPAKISHLPPEEALLLEMQMEPAWAHPSAAETLLESAITRARQTSARQLIFSTGQPHLVALASRHGFTKAARKETHHGPARPAAASLKARYQKALEKHPITVRPIREANLEAVQKLIAASGLLTAAEVQERTPGLPHGFDPQHSFFAGAADHPSALILGFEYQGRVRLHIRLRHPEAKDFPRHGMIALIIAFLDSVTAAGLDEISFVTRSGPHADFATLTRRWGSRSVEFLETLRLPL